MAAGNVTKEFTRLLKNIEAVTDGQATIFEWDDADLSTFKVQIIPNGGYYEGGKFVFRIKIKETYFINNTPPRVFCLTNIYHPNIDVPWDYDDDSSNVCLDILDLGTWKSSFGLEACVAGLVFLFHHPNLEDPLSSLMDELNYDEDDFVENLKEYMAANPVDGWCYAQGEITKQNTVTVNEGAAIGTAEPEVNSDCAESSSSTLNASAHPIGLNRDFKDIQRQTGHSAKDGAPHFNFITKVPVNVLSLMWKTSSFLWRKIIRR